jgi:hypothetical protein
LNVHCAAHHVLTLFCANAAAAAAAAIVGGPCSSSCIGVESGSSNNNVERRPERASLYMIVAIAAAAAAAAAAVVVVSSIWIAVPCEVSPPLNHLRRKHLFYLFWVFNILIWIDQEEIDCERRETNSCSAPSSIKEVCDVEVWKETEKGY